MSKVFKALRVGNAQLEHRLVMSPLTRYRANDQHVHGDLAVEYYGQRASVPGTMLITEATFISPAASGFANVPGIYNQDQITAWKRVTDRVHAKGSFIFVQLWHLGRAAKPDVLKSEGGFDVVSASDIPFEGGATPRPATETEIHGANGYFIDQFLQDVSNQRTDRWGGSIENRARFALEVVKAVTEAIGSERVGIRLSPWTKFQGMGMADPIPQFRYVIEEIAKHKLAYLHVITRWSVYAKPSDPTDTIEFVFEAWGRTSPIVLAGGFTAESARKAVEEEYKDRDVAIAFGRDFISTPDLPFRVRNGIGFNKYDRDTFYLAKSPRGYIDYPFSAEFERAQKL